jgi:predicted RNase H-like nuclease
MVGRSENIWIAGVDGCPDRWMVAFIRPRGKLVRLRVINCFSDILSAPERPAIVVVDIPIGLPNFSPAGGRLAETQVRSLLTIRRSSVFRVPSRRAIYEASASSTRLSDVARYKKACATARRQSEDKKAFAMQGFYLFPKIIEVDQFLRRHKHLRKKIYECHPELAFWRINGERPVEQPKKNPEGIRLRKRLLIKGGIPSCAASARPPKGAKTDDLLDALACALIARRIHAGTAQPFPNPPPCDAYGLPMAIWA